MKQIAYNKSKRTQKPVYIVVHDTGNTGKGADAESHYKYFNSGDRKSSADFFIDDKEILQVNDYNTYYTYHCGDGKGKNGITNSNSVGVEMCVNSDGAYDKAFNNTVECVKTLMKTLNIKADKVVRHYDASGKNCPASFNNGTWNRWKEFKSLLESEDTAMTNEERIKFNKLVNAVSRLSEEVEELKSRNKVYHYGQDIPGWARVPLFNAMEIGVFRGASDDDLNVTEDVLKVITYMDRLGLFKRK